MANPNQLEVATKIGIERNIHERSLIEMEKLCKWLTEKVATLLKEESTLLKQLYSDKYRTIISQLIQDFLWIPEIMYSDDNYENQTPIIHEYYGVFVKNSPDSPKGMPLWAISIWDPKFNKNPTMIDIPITFDIASYHKEGINLMSQAIWSLPEKEAWFYPKNEWVCLYIISTRGEGSHWRFRIETKAIINIDMFSEKSQESTKSSKQRRTKV